MVRKNNFNTVIIAVLAIVFAFTLAMLVLAKVEDKNQYKAFLNEFYSQLDSTLDSVDYLLSVNDLDIANRLADLDNDLETMNLLLRMGDRTVDSRITDQPRFFIGRIIQFENGCLSDEQRSELDKVQKGLNYMKNGLYSQETGQENKKLSVEELVEIIEEGSRIGD